MTSPSSLYAKTQSRSPVHDAMQAEMFRFLTKRIETTAVGDNVFHRHIEVELPIVQNGRVVAFADLAEIWDFKSGRIVNLYEIKPVIGSVGGIIRQMKAMQIAAEHSDLKAAIVSCSAVVPWNDPDLSALKAAYRHVWAWGIQFEGVDDDV